MENIIVIGAGQAGASCVAKLRAEGFEGKITLIGDEPVPPYQRPPLSKAYLLGEMALERLYLRPEAWYGENGIELRLGSTVDAIDAAAKTVTLGDDVLPYDALVLATGSTPRRLPANIGGDLGGVHVVRTLADVDAMEPAVAEGLRALIVGGGYIGLEAAAVARKRGMDVTLVEATPRILGRVAAPETADYFRELHRAQGVRVLEGVGLDCLNGVDGHVVGAILTNGEEHPYDLVIAGIGIIPNDGPAKMAGVEMDNGIATDSKGRTSDPNIYAAGDCASLPFRGQRIRLESVQNAIDQAEAVAKNILGRDEDYVPQPWFWSDQYDVKLQIAGLNTGYDKVIVRDGGAMRSHWYYAGDTLLAVDAMNDPRGYMIGKRLIEAGKSPDPAVIADPESDLKPLLKA
ncbi:NAD(P)/FAD-dependent oxidoreductase [Gymnodinialimonas ceratoperidinii]|uniref:FAD-dependent oxidoreductase n=1 Tax=Gymnodinialimonas ceratoperidinii TaxID=2856823 RepID=A0A8F6TW64_9RHOB|nr:FAD-dependent oxidoreductase [Gymnodinialimonas ceratoperidinii]QXT39785.1 FAD-dependent oxidoreductase [Gymnodinialimonas ceratoperidinii]